MKASVEDAGGSYMTANQKLLSGSTEGSFYESAVNNEAIFDIGNIGNTIIWSKSATDCSM